MPWMLQRRAIVGIAGVVAAAAVVLVVAWFVSGGLSGADSDATSSPSVAAPPVPEGAAMAARDVVSGDDGRARAALSPALDELISPSSAIAPTGSTLEFEPDSWAQRGNYASAIGQLTEPGQPARRVFIGFVLRDDRWRVTALEPTP